MNDLLALYQEVILDHSRHPRHFGELVGATHQAEGVNPLCGDEIKLYITIADQIIKAIQFTGIGCAICMASASLLTEHLAGKTVLEAQDGFAAFMSLAEKGTHPEHYKLDKLSVFGSVHNFPLRVKCATLPWHALKAALIK